jgi:hypothetical protein
MGLITDFVVASDSEAKAIGQSERPADKWPTFEARRVETIKLAYLYCVATGSRYSDEIAGSFSFVGGDQEEGPWVFQFPTSVLQIIAGIEDTKVSSIAEKWILTEEFQRDKWTVEGAADFIEQLRNLARQAVKNGLSLFLWVCL